MPQKNPKISVITPSFNQGNTLEQTMLSVLHQSYPELEYILIDGGSTDKSLEIIQKYEKQLTYWVSEKDRGIYDAMNKGIERASGEWIYFLGTDDLLCSDVLKDIFAEPPEADLIYGNVIFKHSGQIYDGFFDKEKLAHHNICHQAIFFKRQLFDRLGLFELKYQILADYVWNIKCFGKPEIKVVYLNKNIAIYNEIGLSGSKLDLNFIQNQQNLLKDHLGIYLHKKTIYDRVGRLGIKELHQKNYKKGLQLVWMALPYAPIFYIKTLLYFFKKYCLTYRA